MTPLLIALIGVTNTGKSTLIQAMRLCPFIGTIEVGKELRKRYPPSYFDGLGAMEKTEAEVWEIVEEEYEKAKNEGKTVILIDGQPRLPYQVQALLRYQRYAVIELHAPLAILHQRARRRDTDPEHFALSVERLHNDYRQLYEVKTELLRPFSDGTIQNVLLEYYAFDTTDETWITQAADCITTIAQKYHKITPPLDSDSTGE